MYARYYSSFLINSNFRLKITLESVSFFPRILLAPVFQAM